MTALSFNSAALSSIASNSPCCRSLESPFFDGQSIFDTLAIHTPRNSRSGSGGLSWAKKLGAPTKDNGGWQNGHEDGCETHVCEILLYRSRSSISAADDHNLRFRFGMSNA